MWTFPLRKERSESPLYRQILELLTLKVGKLRPTALAVARGGITEQCIRDREGRIVGYLAGYSDAELQSLLQKHASGGWHISHAKYTENGSQ